MSSTIALYAILIVIVLVFQGFFSGSEIALISADKHKLETLREGGNTGARLATELLEREDRLLGTCLIGTNLMVVTGTTLITSAAVTAGVSELAAPLAYIPIALVFGEALPKTVFEHHANKMAPVLSYPISWFQSLFALPLWAVGCWTRALSSLSGEEVIIRITRKELTELIVDDVSVEIDDDERRMIQHVLAIGTIPIEDCMTPLVEVNAVSTTSTVADVVAVAVDHNRSRLPVYSQRVDQLVGVIEVTKLLSLPDEENIHGLITKVPIVPESKRVDALLDELRGTGEHVAIVVDEYGGSVGIVTVEDLLEELFGEIHDERDRDETGLIELSESVFRISGRMEIDALREALPQVRFPEGDYETIAGLLLFHMGRIPGIGEQTTINGVRYRIETASDRSILTVLISLD